MSAVGGGMLFDPENADKAVTILTAFITEVPHPTCKVLSLPPPAVVAATVTHCIKHCVAGRCGRWWMWRPPAAARLSGSGCVSCRP